MARISGMVLGLGLLAILSGIASPASAWDSDDDDNYNHKHKYKPHHRAALIFAPPGVQEPILIPPQYGDGPEYPSPQYPNDPYNPYRIDYGTTPYAPAPDYPLAHQEQTTPQIPLAPPPLPPDQLFGEEAYPTPATEPLVVPPQPEVGVAPEYRPGQFVQVEAPLYPHVRVDGIEDVPRHAVNQIVAVRSPDPFRFPGLVYVPVRVPPGPCRDVKVKDGGAKVEMKYGDFKVKIVSARGVVSVEYDD